MESWAFARRRRSHDYTKKIDAWLYECRHNHLVTLDADDLLELIAALAEKENRFNKLLTDSLIEMAGLRGQIAALEAAMKEKDEEWAKDILRLTETIKYLCGIAVKGERREIREDETVEQFVLGYVKKCEEQIAALIVEIKGWRHVIRECERLLCNDKETAKSPLMSNLPNLIRDMTAERDKLRRMMAVMPESFWASQAALRGEEES